MAWVARAAPPIATIARSAGRQRPDRTRNGRPATVHDPQDGPSALGPAKRRCRRSLGLLVAFHESAPDEPVDGRLVADGDRPISSANSPTVIDAVGEDVERGELGEPKAELAELAGEPDDQLPPEGPAHGHALAELADVLEAVPAARTGADRSASNRRATADAGRRGCADRDGCSDTVQA